MPDFTVSIPDKLITLAGAAHLRRMARLPLAQRTELVVDDAFCRSAVVTALHGGLVGELADSQREQFEADQRGLLEEINRIVGP